ncbi:MAG: DUF4173 domain-containing protein [Oscillospiraceae bacterium]|nr:DUF4173 domain-containing protein [Oscillospiraceae bacterium]
MDENRNESIEQNMMAPPPVPVYEGAGSAYTGNLDITKTFSDREHALALISVALGYMLIRLCGVTLLSEEAIGIGTALTFLCITVYCAVFNKPEKDALTGHIIRSAIAAAFSVNIFLTGNIVIQLLSAAFVVLVLVYDRFSISSESFRIIRPAFLVDMLSAIFSPLINLFGNIPAYKLRRKPGKTAGSICLGLFIAIPSTFLVMVLLSSADERFNQILSVVFDLLFGNWFTTLINTIIYISIGIPAGMYIFSMCRSSKESSFTDIRYQGTKGFISPLTCFVSVVPVCLTYLVFFFSQLSYYVSAFAAILPERAQTYSSYARDGFFELCAVAVINLLIIMAVFLSSKREKAGDEPHILIKVISAVLSVMTVILIATALRKMMLYIEVYGLTQLRLYTSWFMALLSLMFIYIAVRQIFRFNIARAFVLTFTVMFAVLAFCRSDNIIAGYNLSRYAQGSLSELNISTLDTLSIDCIPAVRKYSGLLSAQDTITLEDYITKRTERHFTPETATLGDILY